MSSVNLVRVSKLLWGGQGGVPGVVRVMCVGWEGWFAVVERVVCVGWERWCSWGENGGVLRGGNGGVR